MEPGPLQDAFPARLRAGDAAVRPLHKNVARVHAIAQQCWPTGVEGAEPLTSPFVPRGMLAHDIYTSGASCFRAAR